MGFWTDTDEASNLGYQRGMARAVEIIRNTHWQVSPEGKSIGMLMNELMDTVAATIETEAKRTP